VAIVIAIVVGAVAAVRVAAQEVAPVATLAAVADTEEGRVRS
jgi:hypothetical protein